MASGAAVIILNTLAGDEINIATQSDASNVYVLSRDILLNKEGYKCYVAGIRVEITNLANLDQAYLSIGVRDRLEDAITWLPDEPLADSNNMFWIRKKCRYLTLKIRDEFVTENWLCSAVEVYGRTIGGRWQ